METRDFFSTVFEDLKGRAVITLPNVTGKPVHDHWFQYPEDLDAMVELVEKNRTNDVWYSPILFKSDSRTKDNALVTQVLAADADTCEPDNFRVRPNLIVETSFERYHVYWMLTAGIDPNEGAKVNRRIAQVHKDQGCDTAFVNAAKLLRVPGTSNMKHPGEIVIVNDYNPDAWLGLETLEQAYPADEIPDMIEAVAEDMPQGLEDYVQNTSVMELLTGMPNSTEIKQFFYTTYHDSKRSEALFKLCCLLFEEGMPAETVTAIAWNAKSNKFKDEDPRGIKGLWDTAVSKAKAAVAESHAKGTIGEPYVMPDYTPSLQEPTQFLTLDELELISYTPTFVDEWTAWAKTKTDAPGEYHQAGAIILMSTIYSEFGYLLPTFGKLKLNIWMLLLGRSTKDRKTTSKSYVERMLRLMTNEDFSYILPDDSTPGGLNVALQERADKSSILARDEAQGFFEEMLHQSYMAGGISYFTKLYDGWSGGRARASGDKKIAPSVPISFVFFLMGILTDSADVLTVRNFKQGFLTRFLYVTADRPEGYVEPPLEFLEEEKKEEDDPVFRGLHTQLEVSRAHWDMAHGGGDMAKIGISPEAIKRFTQFREDTVRAVGETKYQEIIDSTSDRMTLSTLKLAALFAMHERQYEVSLTHMLQAIAYSGAWFDNTVEVASMISESEWLRDVNALETHIVNKGGKLSWHRAYQAFSDKKPKDFEEMVQALESRGTMRRVPMGSRWQLEIVNEE